MESKVSVKQCSLCDREVEYYCYDCQKELCIQCKKIHVIDLITKDHKVKSYTEKMKYPPKQIAQSKDHLHVKSPLSQNHNYHEAYAIPVCDPCPENSPKILLTPDQISLLKRRRHDAIERLQYSEIIYHIRSDDIYCRRFMLEGVRHDLKIGHKAVTIRGQSKAEMRGQGLKDLIDDVLAGDLEDRCIIQKTRMTRHMSRLLRYYHRYKHLKYIMVTRPVKFLRIITKKHNPQKDDMRKIINMVVNLMKRIQFVETGKRQAPTNKLMLKLMSSPVLLKVLKANGVYECKHISYVTPHQVWVSDEHSLSLIDTTTGKKLHSVERAKHYLAQTDGIHTVNSNGELIYIDKDRDIKRISFEKKPTSFMTEKDWDWYPFCLYCSPATGDILVGKNYEDTGKVSRYDNDGHLKQRNIPLNPSFPRIYMEPCFITENNNGDIVVSDRGRNAVVVTTDRGAYRFSYMGIGPRGICTDVFSHILVCDEYTKSVQMLDKDGQFLSYLLTEQSPGIIKPYSLSYDIHNHCIIVGSERNKKVAVYRYINRRLDLTGTYHLLSSKN